MSPDEPDLLAGVLLGVAEREEAHRRRRGIAARRRELRIQLRVGEGRESAARVVQQHDLGGAQHTRRDDQLAEHVLGHGGGAGAGGGGVTAGPPVRMTSMSACGNPRIAGRSESRGSMQVTTAIFGTGRWASFGSCRRVYSRFALRALSMMLMLVLHSSRGVGSE